VPSPAVPGSRDRSVDAAGPPCGRFGADNRHEGDPEEHTDDKGGGPAPYADPLSYRLARSRAHLRQCGPIRALEDFPPDHRLRLAPASVRSMRTDAALQTNATTLYAIVIGRELAVKSGAGRSEAARARDRFGKAAPALSLAKGLKSRCGWSALEEPGAAQLLGGPLCMARCCWIRFCMRAMPALMASRATAFCSGVNVA